MDRINYFNGMKIKRITIVSGCGVSISETCVDGVTEIVEKTVEFGSSLHIIYWVLKGEKIYKEIINCPIEVIYEEEE